MLLHITCFAIAYTIVSSFLMAPLVFAEIYNCNGKYQNKPCEDTKSKVSFEEYVPSKEDVLRRGIVQEYKNLLYGLGCLIVSDGVISLKKEINDMEENELKEKLVYYKNISDKARQTFKDHCDIQREQDHRQQQLRVEKEGQRQQAFQKERELEMKNKELQLIQERNWIERNKQHQIRIW